MYICSGVLNCITNIKTKENSNEENEFRLFFQRVILVWNCKVLFLEETLLI